MGSKTKAVQTTQQTSSTSQSEPWGPQQGYLTRGWERAGDLLDMSMTDRPRLNAATSAYDQAAESPWLRNAAQNGALDPTGMRTLRATASGDYLTQNNPYFQQMVNDSIMAIRPQIDTAFAGSGRLGSGAYANALADAATRAATTLGYQDYGRERQNQMQASGLLNQFGLQDAAMRPTLMALPGQFAQAAEDVQRNYDWGNLARYQALIGSPIAGRTQTEGTSVGTQPVQQGSPVLQGLGAFSGLMGGLGMAGGTGGLLGLLGGLPTWMGGGGASFVPNAGSPYGYGSGGYFGQGPFFPRGA